MLWETRELNSHRPLVANPAQSKRNHPQDIPFFLWNGIQFFAQVRNSSFAELDQFLELPRPLITSAFPRLLKADDLQNNFRGRAIGFRFPIGNLTPLSETGPSRRTAKQAAQKLSKITRFMTRLRLGRCLDFTARKCGFSYRVVSVLVPSVCVRKVGT